MTCPADMTATLRQLIPQLSENLLPRTMPNDRELRRQVVRKHRTLELEYKILCAQIAQNLSQKYPTRNEAHFRNQIQTALSEAKILEQLYRDYLNEPISAAAFRKDQGLYQSILNPTILLPSETPEIPFCNTVYSMTLRINLPRFCFLRFRRLLITANPFMRDFERYFRGVNQLAQLTTPLVNYAGWVFFIPRLSTNLFLIAKHLFPSRAWMSQEEIDLGWSTRLYAQLDKHWFELANDTVAFTIGLLNCFVFPAVNFYLIAILLTYDVFLASIRAYREISRLHTIRDKHSVIDNNNPNDISYLQHINARIAYEKKCHFVFISHTIILVLSAILMLPVFGSPILAISGASLALLITIINAIARQKIERNKPRDTIHCLPTTPTQQGLVRFGLFSQAPSTPPQDKPDQDLTPDQGKPS